MKNLITCLTVCVLSSVAFAGNGTPVRGDCTAPTGLYASSDVCHQINLHWDPVDGATAYCIYKNYTNSFPSAVPIGLVDGESFTEFSLCGINYYYWVAVAGNCDCASDSAMGSCLPCNTWTVDDDGMADFNNIQDAIDAASNGDEIIVMPGTYTSTADEVVDMLGKEIWLHSSKGAEVTIIDGGSARRGILCDSGETANTIIEEFTITNGYAIDGGGMYNRYSDPRLENCTFTNNTAGDWGGGMYNVFSSPILTDTTVCGNTHDQIAGAWTDNGGNTIADECPIDCPDINGDGYVNVSDLLTIIDQWGLANSPADVNEDGIVDVLDLLIVVGNWGPCE